MGDNLSCRLCGLAATDDGGMVLCAACRVQLGFTPKEESKAEVQRGYLDPADYLDCVIRAPGHHKMESQRGG